MSGAWLLGALALLLLPAGAGRGRPASGSDAPPGLPRRRPGRSVWPAPRREAALSALAGGAVVAACLALLGIETGLVAAAVLAPATALGLRHLQRRPVPLRVGVATALALDLAAAALRSGRPVADALGRAAPAADPQVAALLERVAGLLRLGAEPAEAWSVLPSESALGPLAAAATRSAVSGLRLAGTFERTAGELRACAGAAASVRAHRAGVLAMAPLGLCFLPAFVCLGVVPVVVGIARTAGGTFR